MTDRTGAAVRIEHAPQRRSERARRARDERASRIAELERETGISDVTDPDQSNTKRGCAMSNVGALGLPEWFYRFAPLSIDALKGPVEQYRAGARDMLLVLRERPWLLDGGRAEFEKARAVRDRIRSHPFICAPGEHQWALNPDPLGMTYFCPRCTLESMVRDGDR